jgi:hypothetical protein
MATMKCMKCGGPMNYEPYYCTEGKCWSWRCIFCCEIIDDVILTNRARSLPYIGMPEENFEAEEAVAA